MAPSFTDLTYFYEIANLLNFSHAAKKLGVSQPSLSMAMSRLEKSLQAALFIRHSQGVTLTQPGRRLFIHVGELLEKWGKTELSIQALNEEVSGKVIIGCHAALISHITVLVTSLLATYPSLEIQVLNDISFKSTQGVIEGSLDLGVVFDPSKHPDLIMHKIKNIEITYWISAEAKFDPSVIICDNQSTQIQFLLRELKKKQNINRICSVNNLDMVAKLTTVGAGMGILPTCFVSYEYATKLKRLINAPAFQGEMYLIYRSENRKMLAKETVLSAIKKLIASLDANIV
ncbi:MAG: LysR family transcriptional regulator [Gammaproteobacteria bacterium]|nr:LysR family transcriptional regulator [Gammaproteobacteria bacterium]